jgi:hypothetical protein
VATSPAPISTVAIVLGLLLAAACLFFTLILTTGMASLASSDAAGNGMAQAFTAVCLILFCILLAALVLTAVLGGRAPPEGRLAILLLTPLAFGAIFMAFNLVTRPDVAPGLWPLAIPGAAPTLIVAYCLWALIPAFRRGVPARVAGFGLLGALGVVCAAIVPLGEMRDHANALEAARIAQWQAKLTATPDGAPLPQWMPFLSSDVYQVEQAARAKILALPSRQSDAEAMLERDQFPFNELRRFDLDPTPALCEKAKASLSRRAAALAPAPGAKPDFDKIARDVDAAAGAILWLVGFDCASDAEARAWEALGRSYGASDIALSDLIDARDPKRLGLELRNAPPKVSMLSAKSSLRAWLGFAYGPGGETEDAPRLIAGARALDHRTADAVDWLTGDYAAGDRFVLMRFLPQLDLDPTPALCKAAFGAIGEDLASVYRPTADSPLPYRQVGERLGVGRPLEALKWLAGAGCDADQQLTTALEVVNAYQPSPEREAMAAALAKLKRTP